MGVTDGPAEAKGVDVASSPPLPPVFVGPAAPAGLEVDFVSPPRLSVAVTGQIVV